MLNRKSHQLVKYTFGLFCAFIIGLVLHSCGKEYSCENCLAKSVFTTDCSGINVKGVYKKGQLLSASNTIELPVHVNTPGTYSFTTDLINGISFIGSATFTDTGLHTISLTGQGAPLSVGSFLLHIDHTSCSFSVSVISEPVTPVIDTFYYTATIDGEHYEASTLLGNGYSAWPGITVIANGTDTATFKGTIGSTVQPSPLNFTQLSIFKGWFNNYSSITYSQFKSFFSPGLYPFGDPDKVPASPLLSGIRIYWRDRNGVLWSSYPSNGQAGRSFVITRCEDGPVGSNFQVKVEAVFNCTLYDTNGNVKILTNGKFYGLFSAL